MALSKAAGRSCLISSLNLSWVGVGWVSKLSVVVIFVEVCNDGLADSDESIDIDLVGDIGVEVVLEVLELVHVALDKLVSPDSWERE